MTDRQALVDVVSERMLKIIGEPAGTTLGENEDLRGFASFDSLSFLEALTWLEGEFGAEVPDEELRSEDFSSVGKIVDFVLSNGTGAGR
ncbi:acyl carrier protein [Streptomyces sp. KhCrAH-43]|uniref:phosphopantetheine-binding protein n=1 Tax=Streptomyces TaxID=1883 RepID=UPI000DC38484|nr:MULTISPECIES: phosphopantetheine-binding protein [unclassified Streptomyces]RAJ68477.1 acyl carrier protein [Streptomyces sp. KhCrAH-43]